MRTRLFAAGLCLIGLLGGCGPPPDGAETVILVHGLGRTSRSLVYLEAHLRGEGYRTVSFDYPSTTETIETLVDSLASVVDHCCNSEPVTAHFVTHSLGGILVRSFLEEQSDTYEGRVVMLAPPNQGSEIIDAFSPSPLLISVLGPAGAALGTDSMSVTSRLGPVRFPLGVIIGDASLTPIGSWIIPGADDGLVGVEQARVEGLTDFLVLPTTHTTIMNRRETVDAIVSFLRTERFGPEGGGLPQ